MHQPAWREFNNTERAQLREEDPVSVLIPGEGTARPAKFLNWSRWSANIQFAGEPEPDHVGPFSLGKRKA